jgi:cell division protein FtsZ
VNVTGGSDMTLLEVDEAANVIADQADPDANIIFGAAFDASLEGKLRVSVVATGMTSGNTDAPIGPAPGAPPPQAEAPGEEATPATRRFW